MLFFTKNRFTLVFSLLLIIALVYLELFIWRGEFYLLSREGFGDLILILTLIGLVHYAEATYQLKESTLQQTNVMIAPFVEILAMNDDGLKVVNVGNGPCQLISIKSDDFNFGKTHLPIWLPRTSETKDSFFIPISGKEYTKFHKDMKRLRGKISDLVRIRKGTKVQTMVSMVFEFEFADIAGIKYKSEIKYAIFYFAKSDCDYHFGESHLLNVTKC
ncbi:hypothetical protein JKY72_04865 [Candidatus Gracilibacteria bacterium]|nr:hypothetical protein [Candidatus Gracilibacteria bacterium]